MPKKIYRRSKGRKPVTHEMTRRKFVISKYMIMSVIAERTILGVGVFPKGIWKEVPERIYQLFNDADGWKGKVEKEEIKGGET